MDILDNWFIAIRNGNLKDVSIILKNNPDIVNKYSTINDGRNHYQTNAIIEASYQGNRDLVKWLIENKADVNSISDGGWRPIHFAAQQGHVTTVNLLVSGGAEVNIETDSKETPIFLALRSYMRDTVKKLLHHGAQLKGIDKNFLHMCIQREVLDPSFLDESNKSYLADMNNYRKLESNGYDILSRLPDKEAEEIKITKIIRVKVATDYDNELKRRRQDLLKKIRRPNEPINHFVSQIRKIANLDGDHDRLDCVQDALVSIQSQESLVPQTKLSDHLINLLELSMCDSNCSDEFVKMTSILMMQILHLNVRRGDGAVVEFWCRIFDKMYNLQIEQYTYQILRMLNVMIENATDGVINNLIQSKDTFLKNWEYFFENLGFSKCLDLSLSVLMSVYPHFPDAVNERFHNVIDIMIGWCVHPDTNLSTLKSLQLRSVDLHPCWMSDLNNLKKILNNLQKDITTNCETLCLIHRMEKERSRVDDLKLKIKHFCFALSCVTSGISKITDILDSDILAKSKSLSNLELLSFQYIISFIERLTEAFIKCSKQIDFDNLLLQSNAVLIHLISLLGNHDSVKLACTPVLRYIFGTTIPLQSRSVIDGSTNINFYNQDMLESFLNIMYITITKICLDPQTLVQIFSPLNWIHSCIFYGSSFCAKLAYKFMKLIELVVHPSTVTTFYQIILSDLEIARNVMLKSVNSSRVVRLVQSNAFKTKTYELAQAEIVVRHNINLLILLYKRTLDPSVFEPSIPLLLAKYLLFTEEDLEKYPKLASLILDSFQTLRFDLTIDFVELFRSIIGIAGLDFNVKELAFRILHDSLKKLSSAVLIQMEDNMINKILECLINIIRASGNRVDRIQEYFSIIEYFKHLWSVNNRLSNMNKLKDLLIQYSMHNSFDIRKKCFILFYTLFSQNDVIDKQQPVISTVKDVQSIFNNGRSFRFYVDFSRNIFSWLLEGVDSDIFNRSSIIRLNDLTQLNSNNEMDFRNRIVLLYELLLNSCWDCVSQKLKFDPNGDSRLTLLTIENIIKYILTSGASIRSVQDKRLRKTLMIFSTKSSSDQALSVNLLLLLLDILEKLFHNSFKGCSIGLPPVNKVTETFFVTNSSVCTDWFLKMRLMITALAQYNGQWSFVVWHGFQLLNHYFQKENNEQTLSAAKVLIPEIEDCIVFTAMALSKLGNWEVLIGLRNLAVSTYGSKFDWLTALADKTIGQISVAIAKFEEYIKNHHDPERMKQSSSEMRLLQRKTASYGSFIIVMEELADCYKLLSDSDSLDAWNVKLNSWKSDNQIPEAKKSSVNWARLSSLAKLSTWNNSNSVIDYQHFNNPSTSEVSWKYRSVVDNCEDNLYESIIEKNSDKLANLKEIVGILSSIQSIADFPNSFCNSDAVLIYERLKCLELCQEDKLPIDINFKNLINHSPTTSLSVVSFCNAIQNRYNLPENFQHHRYMVKWFRTHGNLDYSEQLLRKCFQTFLQSSIDNYNELQLNNCRFPEIRMQLGREHAKLLWTINLKTKAAGLLISSLNDGLLFETSDKTLHNIKCQFNTKSLLTLFNWLNGEKSLLSSLCDDSVTSRNLRFLTELAEVPWINGLPIVSPQQRNLEKYCDSSVTDVCSQLLILTSKSKNPETSDKSFITLAQWCLTRSRSLDDLGLNNSMETIQKQLEECHFSNNEIRAVQTIFSDYFRPSKMDSDNDWLGEPYDDSNFMENLRFAFKSQSFDEQKMDNVLKLWKDMMINHYSLHIAAADAYFSFLKDAAATSNKTCLSNKNKTIANLRILSLLGKRSRVLRDSIISKINQSPPGSWTNVVPQLFARLKHTDESIRFCMTELLQRLATFGNNRIRLIIYPTIVGAINDEKNTMSPYHTIMKFLLENNQTLVSNVGTFIRELRRITVLWDELWISALGQCYDELNKKTHSLQTEIDKLNSLENKQHQDMILKLKYQSIIHPALFILERVRCATSTTAETPRECWFNNNFFEEILHTIEVVKNPADIYQFKDSWKKVKELQDLMINEMTNNMNSKINKRGRHQYLTLKLDEISPSLSKISDGNIPLPGTEDRELLSICNQINILPTKTKPKKLKFSANDGKEYSYLYKGLEDLRLDERIMQILGIVNTMFDKINDRQPNKYHITTYPVTPLGPRAGLIEMVDDATSVFSLYKRHQIRNKNSSLDVLKLRQKPPMNTNNFGTDEATIMSDEGHPIRPTDIYWQKLRPRLDAAKIDTSLDSRDKWPIGILVDVLMELKNETPKDLLTKELWCCSINPQNWFRSSIGFTRSCAVMSIVGHVIGLGDRHLDNLLVNLTTGHIVHIDYNVCFDKGVSLKVPEKVPFRLTDIITDVFGPMEVNGLFTISCENVMEILQQSQDSILTLMDTFVFDPIIDWSTGIECGPYGSFDGGKFAFSTAKSMADKRSVEFMINLRNFQCTLLQIEDNLADCKLKLSMELSDLLKRISDNYQISKNIQQTKQTNNKLLDLISFMKQLDYKRQKNILTEYNYVKSIEDKYANLDSDIEQRLNQLSFVNTGHNNFFNMILSNPDFISLKLDMKNLRLFFDEQVKSLQKSYNDLMHHTNDHRYDSVLKSLTVFSECLDSINEDVTIVEKYRNVILEMPQSFFASDRCSYMLKLTEDLIKERSPDTIDELIAAYTNKWLRTESESIIVSFTNEQKNWTELLKSVGKLSSETQQKLMIHSHEEEIHELENIWQLTVFENVAGINIFKSVILEQYLEMATITAQLDISTVNKIPEQLQLSVDYDAILRKYLQLLNAHDNYFKILTNYMNMFGLFLNTPEASTICNMMLTLQKLCSTISSFESNFIEIIMPESVKIMKNLSADDVEFLDELKSVVVEGDKVLLHFNIALTSSSYDVKSYENIHDKVVLPIKEKLAGITNISSLPLHDSSKQLRILVASFYNTIDQINNLVNEFIDYFINTSFPSSWNYMDIVASSAANISPMWNKSIKMLKDAVFVSSVRCLVSNLEHSKVLTSLRQSELTENNQFFLMSHNMLRSVEVYFNFIYRHILVGVGSQTFSKMFCFLLEFAGWNIDAMVNDSMPNNCALNAEFLCGTVASFRKTEYPNAINFYSQLQYRFNSYKAITGFNFDSNNCSKFIVRNLALLKSFNILATNQLTVHCWSQKHLIGIDADFLKLLEIRDLISTIPNRLLAIKDNLVKLETIFDGFIECDNDVLLSDDAPVSKDIKDALQKLSIDRAQFFAVIKKRIGVINEALVNVDRFECLRSRSTHGSQFDDEVMQFFTETKDLLLKLDRCTGLIRPEEEEIIRLKELYNLNENDDWWQQLIIMNELNVNKSSKELAEQENIMTELMRSYDSEAVDLKALISTEFSPLMGHIKNGLRSLQSSAQRLRKQITDDTVLKDYELKVKVEKVLKLISSIERFNSIIDGLTKFFNNKTELLNISDSGDFIVSLGAHCNSLSYLIDTVIPELFYSLDFLSPLDKQKQLFESNNVRDELIAVASKYGFSNNNMAESNGDNMNRISPLSGDEYIAELYNRSLTISEVDLMHNIGGRQTAIDKSGIMNKGQNTNNTTIINNSTSVQKAIDVWKLVESRINLAQFNSSNRLWLMNNDGDENNTIDVMHQNKQLIAKYVDKLIKTARNHENLARMYEGWTAWV